MQQLQGSSSNQSQQEPQPEWVDLVHRSLVKSSASLTFDLEKIHRKAVRAHGHEPTTIIYSFHNFRFFTGCCCFIPCVMDGFHDYEHMCPQCNAIIGKSTPDDREEEKKKGLRLVFGTLWGTIICTIVLVILYFVLSSAYSFNK